MPVILVVAAFSFLIYTRDHNPPHVHVRCGGGEAKFELGSRPGEARLVQFAGMKRQEIKQALMLVQDHWAFILEEWERIHAR